MPDFFAFIRVFMEYRSPLLDIASIFFVPVGAAWSVGRPLVVLKYSITRDSPISPTENNIPRFRNSISASALKETSSLFDRVLIFFGYVIFR